MIEAKRLIGLVIERRRSTHPWSVVAGQEFSWMPVAVFSDPPEADAWTVLGGTADCLRIYVGPAELTFYSTDTANYRDNLVSGAPKLWVAMRLRDGKPPLDILLVTADPAEGEALTETGDNLVETLPMPDEIASLLASFIAAHHVERPIVKRKRDRAEPELRWRAEPTIAERAAVGGRDPEGGHG